MLLSFIVPAIELAFTVIPPDVLSLSCTEARPFVFFVSETGTFTVSPALAFTLPILRTVSASASEVATAEIGIAIFAITNIIIMNDVNIEIIFFIIFFLSVRFRP